ncbi:MAG: NADPH-dependent glutamate synthase [Candidatus Tectomicrobia bacterium]|uniref:NADPH-dependent glutamate synthase n=1 Tax=Tectimicrobiota bacterium TaxID=2528274 RepID=A0A932GRU5_UNCTE|nr:NADPH-dependent glutamate synthase [Candidatus Tectomicrobia bacterium]
MKIPRQPMPERDPAERARTFEEVPLGFSEETAVLEASRCIHCPHNDCVEGCPVGIDIPAFLRLIEEGDFLGAAQKIREKNVLPAICGRVCPQEQQCEKACILALTKKPSPVSIGRLERFVADYERRSGKIEVPEVPPPTGFRVAVVGSGPAGLTAASELARLGHKVTIFEALHRPGGVLFYGIPRFRLPGEVISAEIESLKKMGVEIVCDAVVGKFATISELFDLGYDAVMIGTGAGLPWFLGIPGENLLGVFSANEFLTRVNLMRADRFPNSITPVRVGKRVAVIGAGDTAMDAARTALRLRPESVTIYYRRSRAEAPCRVEELAHAEAEGVKFEFLTNPLRFIGDEDYRLVAIECQRMELGEPDKSGRRRPVPTPDSNFTVPIDSAIFALGFGVNPLIRQSAPELEVDDRGVLKIDPEKGMTSMLGVFAAGDIVTGGATVILAMGQAKKAAAGIHRYLMEKKLEGSPLEAGASQVSGASENRG